ncbi:unnamed protein product [Meganyctiphanes norvegica]|uniref:Uncharacterized protein n=1 Tax=Meganyctiphanes norvegica TaxID=48144 RepID=A0AAV2SRC1_MEGNR
MTTSNHHRLSQTSHDPGGWENLLVGSLPFSMTPPNSISSQASSETSLYDENREVQDPVYGAEDQRDKIGMEIPILALIHEEYYSGQQIRRSLDADITHNIGDHSVQDTEFTVDRQMLEQDQGDQEDKQTLSEEIANQENLEINNKENSSEMDSDCLPGADMSEENKCYTKIEAIEIDKDEYQGDLDQNSDFSKNEVNNSSSGCEVTSFKFFVEGPEIYEGLSKNNSNDDNIQLSMNNKSREDYTIELTDDENEMELLVEEEDNGPEEEDRRMMVVMKVKEKERNIDEEDLLIEELDLMEEEMRMVDKEIIGEELGEVREMMIRAEGERNGHEDRGRKGRERSIRNAVYQVSEDYRIARATTSKWREKIHGEKARLYKERMYDDAKIFAMRKSDDNRVMFDFTEENISGHDMLSTSGE